GTATSSHISPTASAARARSSSRACATASSVKSCCRVAVLFPIALTMPRRAGHLAGRPPPEVAVQEQQLIHDWNVAGDAVDYRALGPVELDDETLRDGLQCPSVQDPPIAAKIELLHLMAGLGIHTADIGLPGAG